MLTKKKIAKRYSMFRYGFCREGEKMGEDKGREKERQEGKGDKDEGKTKVV